MAELNTRQELFCYEYIKDLNATQAAIRAGYSAKTANRISSLLLTKIDVSNLVAKLMEKRMDKVKVDAEYVLNRLVEIDQMDVKDILNDNSEILPITEWPKVWRISLSGIEVSELIQEGNVAGLLKKIKWPDKVKNLELIGKHINVGAFNEKLVTVNINNEKQLDEMSDDELLNIAKGD